MLLPFYYVSYGQNEESLIRPKGFELAYSIDKGFADKEIISFGLLGGYKFSPNVSAGLFLGVSGFQYDNLGGDPFMDIKSTLLNVFAHGQYRLTDKKFSPLFVLETGIRQDITKYFTTKEKDVTNKTVLLVKPSVGGSLRVNKNSYFEFTVGYNLGTNAINARTEGTHLYDAVSSSGLNARIGWRHTFGKSPEWVKERRRERNNNIWNAVGTGLNIVNTVAESVAGQNSNITFTPSPEQQTTIKSGKTPKTSREKHCTACGGLGNCKHCMGTGYNNNKWDGGSRVPCGVCNKNDRAPASKKGKCTHCGGTGKK